MNDFFLTKYDGKITNEAMKDYFKSLIGRLWKILPLKEQHCSTLDKYLLNLKLELMGGEEMLLENGLYVELLNNIESLSTMEDKKDYKPQIFRCINICEKIIVKLGD